MSRDAIIAAKAAWRNAAGRQPDLKVSLATSFTSEALVPFLGSGLLEHSFMPAIHVAGYNQIFQVCLEPGRLPSVPDVLVLLWRIDDLLVADLERFLAGDAKGLQDAKQKTADLVAAFGQLRAQFNGLIVVGLPPFPETATANLLNLQNPEIAGLFHREICALFLDLVRRVPAIRVFDFDALQRWHGVERSYDARKWYLYHQPYTDSLLLEVGRHLARIVVADRRARKKCIVLDCDNTLWGGVVGEDGLAGIQIGADFPGSAFQDLQRQLLYWRSQGVLLAIASKNNEADVWEVFDKHDGMVLRRDHISAWAIDWNPKPSNLPKIAEKLNIGTDSFVFLDDNPFEIAQMREAWPDVASVQLAEDPASMLGQLKGFRFFDALEITDEDRQRSDMMQSERRREEVASTMTHGQFLEDLRLSVTVFVAEDEHLARMVQLINKSNQFNLTTRRRTLDDLRLLQKSPRHRVYGMRVADRFGDYGLVGVVILEAEAGAVWVIDTLLMSCRVLGRGVEAALFGILAAEAKAGGICRIIGEYIPTAKNALVANLYRDHGFAKGDVASVWTITPEQISPIPRHIAAGWPTEREPQAGILQAAS